MIIVVLIHRFKTHILFGANEMAIRCLESRDEPYLRIPAGDHVGGQLHNLAALGAQIRGLRTGENYHCFVR